MTDKERLDWLENECGSGLISDDAGRWAVSDGGMQNVPDADQPIDISTVFFVDADKWMPSIREAIDMAMVRRQPMNIKMNFRENLAKGCKEIACFMKSITYDELDEQDKEMLRRDAEDLIDIFKEFIDELPDAQDITGKPTGYIKRKAINEKMKAKDG